MLAVDADFPFVIKSMPFLTVDAIIGNQACQCGHC